MFFLTLIQFFYAKINSNVFTCDKVIQDFQAGSRARSPIECDCLRDIPEEPGTKGITHQGD